MFNEDEPQIGAFNYRLIGFQKQPTDHYMRTMMLAKRRKPEQENCVMPHQTQLNWTKQFLESYKESPKFVMFFNKIGHDSLKMLGYADEDLLALLQGMYNDGTLDNSMVFLFGDHGSRFGILRESLQVSLLFAHANYGQGRLEEKTPAGYLILPKRFVQKYEGMAANLKANQHVLTTHYGIHIFGRLAYYYRHSRHNGASITYTAYKFNHCFYSSKQVPNEFV
jgi:hypothetical protein